MNIIFVGKFRGKPLRCQLDRPRQFIVCLSLFTTLVGALVFAGYQLGRQQAEQNNLLTLENDIDQQKQLIEQARNEARADIDALASRIGRIQAAILRLNALGEHLIEVAKLDPAEFDFDHAPAYGGPVEAEAQVGLDFDHIMQDLDRQLASRENQLTLLEDILLNRQLTAEATPSGRPIRKGWTSSYFGKRTDPFTGKLAMHKGMDFAGKEGSEVIAVADGVVTWAGKRYGYGNLVEITHGNGYATRYGHNEKILVKLGQNVKKGQTISLMGSTGRSTGPHVHFEVLKNDRQINPARFVANK